MHVAPIVFEFMAQHPALSTRLFFVDNVIDMMEEAIDVAVRIGALPESSLRARRVGSVRRVLCASPAYLAAHGTPQNPTQLASHSLIGFAGLSPHRHWTFYKRGKSQTISAEPRLLVNGADVAIAAALAGHGIARVLSYQVAGAVRDGQLVVVLADHEPPASPIHIVHGDGPDASARVRAFVELCARRLRALDATECLLPA
jgi:DNA-binding transcriptional LysR family regulator